MAVSLKDLREAFEFVSTGGGDEHQAFLCKQSGKLYWHSVLCDDLDKLPADIDDSEKFLQIPDKRELDLGNRSRWTSPVNSCRPTSMRFGDFSAAGVPTQGSRICCIEGVRSINGMISRRKPRKEL